MNGFYDISKRPKTLTKKEHTKLIETQNLLKRCNERLEEYKKDPINFKVLQEISSRYQALVFKHYPEEGTNDEN